MFEVRTDKPPVGHSRDDGPSLSPELMTDTRLPEQIAEEDEKKAHLSLMEVLHDEGERQAEERYQMAIDNDYHDHMHWRPEDAQAVIERGQAPLVFNEGRQTIEWISGTEKRMRTDYKVFPREPDDTQGADLKTKLVKYTDDLNLTQWHQSKAFKESIICGLSWLEEGINQNPREEIIYSGMESWRNVIRDSRSRDVMRRDARFLFRRKRLDLDYAAAMLQRLPGFEHKRSQLIADGRTSLDGSVDDDSTSPWYLGQKLTGASELTHGQQKLHSFESVGASLQGAGYWDSGRRQSVDMIEAWYRRPTSVQVFVGGAFDGTIYNPTDPRLAWEKKQGTPLRDAVDMQMHVMLCTERTCFYNGPSPFRHGQFLLVPIFAYQRGRDGQAYGVWRGMRDLSDDTNKRRSKALWQLSVNQIIAEKSAVDDLDTLRDEAARPDGIIIIEKAGAKLEFREHQADIAGNLEMARENQQAMRNIGGVTSENLGMNTAAQSGKAILAKQDQGSLTTSELFDNYLLAKKMAGQLRLSHMEQFWTQKKAIRIVGASKKLEWVVINELDPETGEVKNDITKRQADYIVETQDYRSVMAQAALEQMFDLLGKIAVFAPQVVLNVLDLVVETADLQDKEEWVARIRKLNGQRDPSKEMTPEEQAQEAVGAAKMAKAEATQELLVEAELKLKQAMAGKADNEATMKMVEGVMKRMETMAAALEVAGIVTAQPHLADAADILTDEAGLPQAGPKMNMAQAASEAPPQPAPDAAPQSPTIEQQEAAPIDPMVQPPMPEAPPQPDAAALPPPTGEPIP